ncbi:ATP-dependent Clp protease proteolytic subunit [Babesia ovata]|uniref:ATP-dependent Clp protease proteolytic subunit n=1 Tax=Babesia ovata TaxID=189622 RepID=A0A2H6KDT0_9APIC|nr:ATP-dependent Clp protease proteolytic subunit [Babesia ovata]GBE61146.1 ATP-dependent Clp protease proteolytic subunit [Babesia ovata]
MVIAIVIALGCQILAEAFQTHGAGSSNPQLRNLYNFGAPRSTAKTLYMAPIGIPKVEYKVPGTQRSEWEDIHTRLYRERILFVSQKLDDEYVNLLISALLCLDNETHEKPITLYINSQGGPINAGIALFDTVKHIKSKVATINVGFCGATASLLLGSGTPGMRAALPHSRVLMHQPTGALRGSAEQLKNDAKHLLEVKTLLHNLYSRVTNQPLDKITADIERDNFMSAEESKEYGLIDRIIQPSDRTDGQIM